MHQLIRTYYKAVKVAKQIQSGLDTTAVTKMDELGIINS